MEIHYQLTEEDYLNYNMFNLKNSKTAMGNMRKQQFSVPILYILLSFLLSYINDTPFLFVFIPFLIFSLIWVFVYPKYFYNRAYRTVKKRIREKKNEGMFGDHKMILTDDGLVNSDNLGESKVSWQGVIEFKEDQDYIFLYVSAVNAYLLPKRDIQDVEELRKFLESKVQ